MLTLQGVTYVHPNKDVLFTDINININKHEKIALIGNNGVGKSTLLKILSGELVPSAGFVKSETKPYYIPQLFGQFNSHSVAQALRIESKLHALHEILRGEVTDTNLALLDNNWSIEERCQEALAHWSLAGLDLNQSMSSLSGGQKTKVFLAGIMIHQPEMVLLDEPSNHLDIYSRAILYDYIASASHALMVVSHDRTLLNLLPVVYEMNKHGITVYGGNYDFYTEQKQIENNALTQELKSKTKALRKAKEVERESMERQEKLDARGKKKQEKAGLPTIMMNTFRNNAEKSTARLKGVHAEKIGTIAQEVNQLRKELPDIDTMKMNLDNAMLHRGKVLVTANKINYTYNSALLWKLHLDFQIRSGDRIAIKGANGSGKTTLIKIILGTLEPGIGILERADVKSIYIDQDYSLIDNSKSVYDQAQKYNTTNLEEHEVKIRLNRFLFPKEDWDKSCSALSGGEKMRLMLCCLTIGNRAPDMIILDEPTNNLDIQNLEILTAAINEYQGTLIVVSHDESFLKQIAVERYIEM
jgi:ATPase subunit of ABC transporter with duplicated ATPase domains